MNLPSWLMIPAHLRRTKVAPPAPRALPGPPVLSIDWTIEEPTTEIPAEQLEWLLAQARAAR